MRNDPMNLIETDAPTGTPAANLQSLRIRTLAWFIDCALGVEAKRCLRFEFLPLDDVRADVYVSPNGNEARVSVPRNWLSMVERRGLAVLGAALVLDAIRPFEIAPRTVLFESTMLRFDRRGLRFRSERAYALHRVSRTGRQFAKALSVPSARKLLLEHGAQCASKIDLEESIDDEILRTQAAAVGRRSASRHRRM